MHRLVNAVGLVKAINLKLQILDRRRPYSDGWQVPGGCSVVAEYVGEASTR